MMRSRPFTAEDASEAPGPFARAVAPQVACVTADAALAEALRAAAPSASFATAATPFELADLLLSGSCGVLVMDLTELGTSAATVIHHLAHQFADIPIIGIGTRHEEAEVAGLISTGEVYRFLHRPVSAQRAQTFLEAALRRHEELKLTAHTLKSAAPHASATGPTTQRLGTGSRLATGSRVATGARHAHTSTMSSQYLERPWYQSMPLVSVLGAIAIAVVALALGLTLRDTVHRTSRPPEPETPALTPGRNAVRGLLRPAEAPAPAAPTRRSARSRAAAAAPAAPTPAAAPATATPAAAPPAAAPAEADAPRKIKGAKPDYPEAAALTGLEGWVDVHFTVSPEGTPENITVTGADPADVFDAAALEAVAKWRYAPRATPGEVDNRIRFKPADPPAAAVTPDPPKG